MLERSRFRCMTTEIELLLDTDAAEVVGEGLPARTALQQAEHFFQTVERRFSRFRPDSELAQLNSRSGETVRVSPDLAALVSLALAAARASDGVFDPTVIEALEAAGYDRSIDAIRTGGTHAPRPVAARPGRWQQVAVDTAAGTVRLPAGVRLDLGGIGKGWAADRAAAMLQPVGAGMIDAGGDIRAWGDQPGCAPGQGWLVAVDDPQQPGRDLAWLQARDGAVATSSITARRWAGGHHLIDPYTARPARTDVLSVTALAPTAVEAEVAAKVALILGREAGLAWLAKQPAVKAILVDETGALSGTQGIEGLLA